ncbi:hypothetical protein F7C95_04410 [Opitutia bacterium ISCC 51]|nr:hypothetical protein F7C95_04410 [Opitutae bacterium ISCC 51]QXD29220.1 hypothetical protein GA003_04390 [Opitutae bacterium ISCC 52]
MNTKELIRKRSAWLLAALMFSSTSFVQVNAQEDEDEVFDLSPFTITSEEDTGYAATSTLAGSRLKSNLKDLAGPIQIVTEEFLEDTAVTSTEDLFLYTTSTEASGPDGNYGGGGAERRDPNVTRVRGLANPDRTRGYFLTNIGFDTYNTDRVAIAKGPNAILFGLGSPAGIVNNNLKQARFEETNSIKLQYGSWGAHREIIDINRVLIEDLVAFRIIGLNNEIKYKQKPSYSDERRLYGTFLITPYEKTTIRANFETGSRDASRPNTSSPTSNIPTWIADGMPVTTGNFSQSGFGTYTGNRAPQFIYGEPDATTPSVGFDPQPATSGPDGIRRQHYTAANREETSGGTFSQGVLTDETGYVFDFRNKSLSGLDNTQANSFDAFNLSLEHQFGENAGIELVWDEQSYDLFSRDRIQNTIAVDASSFLPYYKFENGGVFDPINPNVGRPYVWGVENMRQEVTDREAWRATAYYDLDLRDSDMGWLGRHVFTALASNQAFDITRSGNNYGSVITGEARDVLQGNRNRTYTASSWDRRIIGTRFLGPKISGIPSSGHLAERVLTDGTPRLNEYNAWMYDSQATAVRDGDNGAYREVNATVLVDPLTRGSLDRQEIDSLALTAQSYFWDDNIIATYGWREDDATSWRDVADQSANNIALMDTLSLGDPTDNVKGDVFTWGLVAHLPTEDFLGGWGISGHYGESENFVPSPGRITILNQPHPSPAGETTEYGFSVEAPNNKFYVRVNWYETVSQNQTDSALGSASIPNWERLFYNNVRNSLQEKEPRDATVPASEYETWDADDPRLWPNNINWADTYRLPPLGMREAFWNPVNPDPSPGGTNSVSDSPNSNVTGVSDFASEGLEIEGVWNPTDNWTIAFNAAQMEVVKTNVLQSYREYFDTREPDWIAMGDLVARPNTYKNENPQTIYQRTRTVQWPRLLREISQDGRGSHEIREWRYNFVSNYNFDLDGPLAGWSVGGAYRWQDDVAIGYEDGFFSDTGIQGIDGVAVSDVTKPIFGPSEDNLDLWVTHKRKIFDDKVDWRIQLNIRNVLDDDDLIFTSVDGDGTPTRVRIVNPMNFRITSTFSF